MRGVRRRPDRRKARNRRALLEAAERLFAQKGIERVSIDEITETADLSKGTFYAYFSDKEAIAAEIALAARAELAKEVAVAQTGSSDPAERWVLGICVFLRCAADRPSRAAVIAQMFRLWLRPEAKGNEDLRLDLEHGYREARFTAANIVAANVLTVGLVEAGIGQAISVNDRGNVRALTQNLCELALRALGVTSRQAQAISRRSVAYVFD